MPVVHIDIIKRGVREKRALVSAVTEAICTSLKVSPASVHIVINEMAPDQYATDGQLYADRKPAKQTKKKR